MNRRYARPAVYLERSDAIGPEPIVLRTDIAAFVGIARRGPLDTPVAIESFRQFVAHFGEFTGAGYLAYAVRGFFENGGRRCWVVRVASRDAAGGARAAAVTLHDRDGRPVLRVAASSPGTWGNALSLQWAAESGAAASSLPAQTSAHHATVTSTAGFARGVLARIEQPGAPTIFRVVSAVEADKNRLYWVHPEPGRGLPTDRRLSGVDLGRPLRISRVAYSLTVREGGRVRALFGDLHLIAGHERFVGRVLAVPEYRPAWLSPNRQRLTPGVADAPEYDAAWTQSHGRREADLPRAAQPVVAVSLLDDVSVIPLPLDAPVDQELELAGGADGLAALRIEDFIGAPLAPEDSDWIRAHKTRGLEALAPIEEIALIAMPDILIRPDADPQYEPVTTPPVDPCVVCPAPPPRQRIHQPPRPGELPNAFSDADIMRAQAALLARCEALGDRFAVLSLPFGLADRPAGSREQIIRWRRQFDSRYGALYAPWLDVLEPRRTARTRRVPGCGHVAGAIARTDLAEGVHRAPANLVIHGAVDLSRPFDDTDHGELNLSGVDVLRGEFGRPPMLSGARTLSFDPEWRFINTVRLVLAIKKAIDIGLRWVVFEPNSAATRAAVAATLTALLQLFFERGAFRGATPETSYFVRCDEVTTPPPSREAGQLIALVGIAPAAPCEFIVLRVGRERNTLSITLYGETETLHA